MPRRITLLSLLAVVACLGVGLGVMRLASEFATQVVYTLALVIHASALVGTIQRRGADPSWLGFTVLGWVVFVAVASEQFNGRSGGLLISWDLSERAYARIEPRPTAPIFEGVSLDDEPDRATASDALLKAYAKFQEKVGERGSREREFQEMADLLASLVAGLLGAGIGPLLAPRTELPAGPSKEPAP